MLSKAVNCPISVGIAEIRFSLRSLWLVRAVDLMDQLMDWYQIGKSKPRELGVARKVERTRIGGGVEGEEEKQQGMRKGMGECACGGKGGEGGRGRGGGGETINKTIQPAGTPNITRKSRPRKCHSGPSHPKTVRTLTGWRWQ